MTLEEFKKEFLNRSICIYAPTNEEVDVIKNAMVSSGLVSHKGTYYDAQDYPYIIYRFGFDRLTGWTGEGPLQAEHTTKISSFECLALLDGTSDDSNNIDISSFL